MEQARRGRRNIYGTKAIMELFDIGPVAALAIMVLVLVALVAGTVFFFQSAPPKKLTMLTGPEGSTFHDTGLKYAEALKKHGVTVEVLSSSGSLENLKKISEPKTRVDLVLVQGGVFDDEVPTENLVSLGVVRHQPIFFFYRGKAVERLVEMRGRTLAIGAAGTGTNKLARKLLELNKIKEAEGQQTKLLELDGKDATRAILDGKIDGAFMMGGYSSLNDLRRLMRAEDVQLLSFKNASAYTRKIDFLHVMDLPEGVIDIARNIPPQNVKLVGPQAELVATNRLHHALSDLILEAARSIHGSAGLFQKHGEFPAPVAHHIPLSEDAEHYYKSGKTFLYRYLPFWLASLTGRFLVIFLPMIILLVPLIKSAPALLRWLGELRIRRRYRALLQLEEEIKNEHDDEKLAELYRDFEDIERDVRNMRIRAAFAEQFYFLRVHIDYVRRMIARK